MHTATSINKTRSEFLMPRQFTEYDVKSIKVQDWELLRFHLYLYFFSFVSYGHSFIFFNIFFSSKWVWCYGHACMPMHIIILDLKKRHDHHSIFIDFDSQQRSGCFIFSVAFFVDVFVIFRICIDQQKIRSFRRGFKLYIIVLFKIFLTVLIDSW